MSKKIIIISTIVLLIFFVSLAGYYFLLQSNENATNGEPFSFKSFLPFGGDTPTPVEQNPITEPEENTPDINFAVKLRKLWLEPVAGAYIYDAIEGSTVRLVERSTGHVYEVSLYSPETKRISNTTIPKVYDAIWMSKTSFIAQYLGDDNQSVSTFIVKINEPTASTTEGTSSGNLFGESVDNISVGNNRIFYLDNVLSGSKGFTSSFTGGNIKQIWNSPIAGFQTQNINSTNVAIFTKPYPNIGGFLYFINTNSGSSKKILGNLPGLTVLVSPDALNVVTLTQSDSNIFSVYNISKNENLRLNPVTFPEKCVWSKKDTKIFYCAVPKESLSSNSLISWYFGMTSFNDSIWKYSTEKASAEIVDGLDKEGIDVIKPTLNDSEKYLIFTNKKDGSLWSLDLEQ
ncbi:MAG: hypothetical protein WC095_00925 [Candidatus Paceibacterota bacterium]